MTVDARYRAIEGESRASKRGAIRQSRREKPATQVSINLKVVIVPLLVCGLVGLVYGLYGELNKALDVPVAAVSIINGDFRYSDKQRLSKVMEDVLDQGFLTVNLHALKRDLEGLAWVYSVDIKRKWPDVLVLSVREQNPVAYWNDKAMMNEFGEVFEPLHSVDIEGIPRLYGREDSQIAVMAQYASLREQMKDLDLVIASLKQDGKGSWQIELAEGIKLALGDSDISQKIDRFLVVYQQSLIHRLSEIDRIDMRYTNGVAVQWHDDIAAANNNTRGKTH